MKKYIYIIFILIFISNSCKDENNIIDPINSDVELQNQIIGTWQMQYGTRTLIYNSNFTFRDSSASFVVQGTYSIKDSIIYKTNINVRFIDPSYYPNPGYDFTFETKYLKFSYNKMTEIPLTIFEPTIDDNNSELWGNWTRTFWTYQLRYNEPSYLGRLKIIMILDEASHSANWWFEYIDGITNTKSDTLRSSNVIYNPPTLDLLGTGDYLVQVMFTNDKMYWWEPNEPIEFSRVN